MSALPLRLPEPELRDRLLWIGTGPGASAEDLAEICEIEEIPASAALAAILARQPDVVVARVEEGGLDLLRELRRDRQARDLPILLVGASEERCLDGLEEGASDVLVEPVSSRALAARVAAALRAARARREALLRERDLLAESQMAAEALDRSEERFQAFLRNSPVASWMTDEEGRVLFLSEPYSRMFGLRSEEAIGRSLFDLYPLPFAQTFYDNIRAVAETNGTLETIEDAPLPDGTVGHFLVFKFPVRDASGRLLVGGVAADITGMKRAGEALRESEERFRLATEAVNGMIYDWSLDTDAVQRSQGLLPLLGYWPDEVAGQLDWWKGRIHPEDVARVQREIWGAIDGGGASFSTEYRALHRDGHWIHAWDKGLVVRDAEGRPVRVVGSTIDISDRQRVQEELARAHREAQAANEAKDRFLATLSHELRTPLTPVLAVLSRLEADRGLGSHGDELATIRRNVELEARLIDDLLDLTRVASGKLELHRREIDLRQVLEHALATIERELSRKGLRLEVTLAGEEHRLWADAPRLTQVFWNLLSNAVKFTPPGGWIRLRSTVEPGTRELTVEVRDSGIGIATDVLPRIFEAFEQTDRRITRKFGGLGLGLAVSRAIVDLHGGRLMAASEGRGRGAVFTVCLPLGSVQEELEETGIWLSRPHLHEVSVKPDRALRILLVEDHEDTARAMADLLGLMGHEVTLAGSVATALAAAEEVRGGGIDLVVSDLGLPDGSGQDLMRELIRLYGWKGIALSGYGMEEDVRRSREAGFARHLTKPVDLDTLRAAIRQVAG
ncbi:MAG TPA: PAS domain S-box protein [Thermoanaerobaculia bacterium]|nr:PAS domain S-box protein [Thermoanaerobaculia bacterium]